MFLNFWYISEIVFNRLGNWRYLKIFNNIFLGKLYSFIFIRNI